MLGTGDIELTRDLAERAMWALLRLADQPGPVKRRGSSNATGIARRRRQRVGTAHTVAMAAHRARCHRLLPIDKREHGSDILHHRRDRHRGAYRAHACMLRAARLADVWPKDRVPPRAVV